MSTTINDGSIKKFISNMVDKNYKDANTSLQQMIEDKLKDRIKDVAFVKKTTEIDK